MTKAFVSPTTIRFLWRELAPFYHAPLRPLPGDRLESQIMIDRPEIEGLTPPLLAVDAQPGSASGFLAPRPDPTVAEFGRHLDLMAGWTIRSAA